MNYTVPKRIVAAHGRDPEALEIEVQFAPMRKADGSIDFAASEAAGRFRDHPPDVIDEDFACLERVIGQVLEDLGCAERQRTARG